jgi:hypothetical protein
MMVLIFFKYSGSADINQGTIPLLPCTPSATAFMSNVEEVATVAAASGFCDISTQAIYPNSVEGPNRGDGYNAPLLQRISFIPYNGGWASETGMEILNGMS